VLALAAVAHLRVDGRDDPVGARAPMQARNAVVVDVEVLADQLAQQAMSVGNALVTEQPVRLLDRLLRALGVPRDPCQHSLPLSLSRQRQSAFALDAGVAEPARLALTSS
jgi:hypothetical protein